VSATRQIAAADPSRRITPIRIWWDPIGLTLLVHEAAMMTWDDAGGAGRDAPLASNPVGLRTCQPIVVTHDGATRMPRHTVK